MWIEIFIKDLDKKNIIIDVTGKRTKSSRGNSFDYYALSTLQELISNEWVENTIINGAVDWAVKVNKQDILYFLDIVQGKHNGRFLLNDLKNKIQLLEKDKYYELAGEES